MHKSKLKYLYEDMDRHGNVRIYFRRRGQPKIRLPNPADETFAHAYKQALAGTYKSTRETAHRAKVGSVRHLCEAYYRSAEYKQLSMRTQWVRRKILDSFSEKHGDKPTSLLKPRHLRDLRNELSDRPESANALLKSLRQVFLVGVELGLVDKNPVKEVRYLRTYSPGFHSWTLDEIRQYESTHPLGTKAWLALALLLYTGQRRSDIVKFGRQHVRKGHLRFTQHKDRHRKPVSLTIPIIPELQRTLDDSPCGDLTFLVTHFGKPFTAEGFGNRFRKWCDKANLPHCSAHGLRKAAAARLAELGCTEHEIMAVTGHRTSKEVARYTQAVRQEVLAESAMTKLASGQTMNKSDPPNERILQSGSKTNAK